MTECKQKTVTEMSITNTLELHCWLYRERHKEDGPRVVQYRYLVDFDGQQCTQMSCVVDIDV